MIGVLLAGGNATRLPNKILLPLPGGPCALMRALASMTMRGCTRLIVLDQPNSLIQVILPKYAFGPPDGPRMQAEFLVDDHTGIPAALSKCSKFNEMVAVFCADNLYPFEEDLPLVRCAVVRTAGITEPMTHLDWHDGKQWRHRDPDKIGGFALSTPWLLTPEDLKEGASFNDVVAWFNSIKLPARMMPYSHEWRDIGTEESYKNIWKEWP